MWLLQQHSGAFHDDPKGLLAVGTEGKKWQLSWPRGGKQAGLVAFKWEAALLLLVGRQGGNAPVHGSAEKQDRKYIKEEVLGVLFTCTRLFHLLGLSSCCFLYYFIVIIIIILLFHCSALYSPMFTMQPGGWAPLPCFWGEQGRRAHCVLQIQVW